MSGGHFEYNCFSISQFADDLQHEIDINDSDEDDGYGGTIGPQYSDYTIERLVKARKIISFAGKLAREIEWLYSGDHGEESFRRLFDEIWEKEGNNC